MILRALTPTAAAGRARVERALRDRETAFGGSAAREVLAAVDALGVAVAREAFCDGAAFAGGQRWVAGRHFDQLLAGLRKQTTTKED